MAVASSFDSKQNFPDQKGKTSNSDKKEKKSRKQSERSCSSPAKRTKCPGLVGDPVDVSENGKTCHQCHKKTMGFVAACKNQKKHKPCNIKFCDRCLMNRYGKKTEDMAVLEDWNCPKCQGICNCSFCMKKRGHQPTGILVLAARANGFSSVSELLHAKGIENFGIDKAVKGMNIGPTKAAATKIKHTVSLPKNNYADIPLPQGTELTTVAGIDLSVKDVGHALQFLEFCAAFKEILDLKEGEPEYVLHELIRWGSGCRGKYSPVVRFHIQLLSLIRKDLGENKTISWIEDQNSKFVARVKEVKERIFSAKHKEKQLKQKMQDQVVEAIIAKKGASLSVSEHEAIVAQIKVEATQAHAEMLASKAMVPMGIELHPGERPWFSAHLFEPWHFCARHTFVKKISLGSRAYSYWQLSELLANLKHFLGTPLVPFLKLLESGFSNKCISDAVRTEPVLFDNKGGAFWRLNGYSDESKVLLQDVGARDAIGSDEKWFPYDVEQEKEIENYICSSRFPYPKPGR